MATNNPMEAFSKEITSLLYEVVGESFSLIEDVVHSNADDQGLIRVELVSEILVNLYDDLYFDLKFKDIVKH